ncbi:MAG: ATP-binding protein [Polyangiaceae bacterium]|nr:ATP-binding protein [Polyangiaceae bacterium]
MDQTPTIPPPSPFELKVDLNVLDHLGIHLYTGVVPVLTETIANAWDADAAAVEIHIDPDGEWMSIEDDGIGMSVEDLNKKYLRVGYRRREDADEFARVTAKGRPVMGRKGLGKLSLFSLANEIEVQSAYRGSRGDGFTMRLADIKTAIEAGLPYAPEQLPSDRVEIKRGTRIVLRDTNRHRLLGTDALRKSLARRFTVIGESSGFSIRINGVPITVADMDDLRVTSLMWTFGDVGQDVLEKEGVLEHEALEPRLDNWDPRWSVRGWIGTARSPKDLVSAEVGSLNTIAVFARGRLFDENLLFRLNLGRTLKMHLTGHVEAEFLDIDTEPDIATSGREGVQEDADRFRALLDFMRGAFKQIEPCWQAWRRKHGLIEARRDVPGIEGWLNSQADGHRASAEQLIAQLSALTLDNEEDRKQLYQHGVYAFESMRLRGTEAQLVHHDVDVKHLLRILADRDALEDLKYRDIVRSRLETIRAFQQIVDTDAKDKVLQAHIVNNIWLLDPAWERAASSELMESRLREAGVLVHDMKQKEKLGRLDIKYRTIAGKHVIVELKRSDRKLGLGDLVRQGSLYVDKLRKILAAQGVNSPDIEVVFVLGKPVDEETSNPDRVKYMMAGVSLGSRIVHYDALIQSALNAYADYLEKDRKLDEIVQIVDRIGNHKPDDLF